MSLGGEVAVEFEVALANSGSHLVVREVPEEAFAGFAICVEDLVALAHEDWGDVEAA